MGRSKKLGEIKEKQKNKMPLLLVILRYLSVIAALFVIFPLLFATETYLQAATMESVIILRFGMVIVCGLIGFLVSMLLSLSREKWKVPIWTINVICALLCMLPAVFMFVCCGGNFESFRTPIMMLYGILAYFMGAIYYYRPYSQINTKVTLAWLCGLHIVVMVLISMIAFNTGHNITAADQPLTDGIAISQTQAFLLDSEAISRLKQNGFQFDFFIFVPEFLIYISIFGLVMNQSHIDFLMERRKHNMEDLPRWVRTYNVGLTSAIMAVIAVLFLCKDWIISSIKWLAKMISVGIYHALHWVGSLFINDAISTDPMGGATDVPDELVEIGGASADPRITMFFSYFLVFVIIVMVIWGIWRFKILSKFWKFLKKTSNALLHQLKYGHKENTRTEFVEQEYIDSETELDQNARKTKKRDDGSAFKQWRKEYKQFLKLKESKQRYEQGFLLLTDYFKLRGVPLFEGDTAVQVSEKAVKSKKIEAFSSNAITEGYNLLCYAESGCKQDKLTVLEQALQKAYTDSKSLKTIGV